VMICAFLQLTRACYNNGGICSGIGIFCKYTGVYTSDTVFILIGQKADLLEF